MPTERQIRVIGIVLEKANNPNAQSIVANWVYPGEN